MEAEAQRGSWKKRREGAKSEGRGEREGVEGLRRPEHLPCALFRRAAPIVLRRRTPTPAYPTAFLEHEHESAHETGSFVGLLASEARDSAQRLRLRFASDRKKSR